MKDVKDVTCCVYDHGLFLPLALKLAKTYKRVFYFSPWEEGFSTVNKAIIGDGFDEIERCESIWDIKSEVDLFVFPDIHHSGEQLELESQGFKVWGSRKGDSLELMRHQFHKVLGEIGLDVAKFESVHGLTRLTEYLRDKKDKYIKLSKYRGSFETFHWRSWDEDNHWLCIWGVRFGPAKDKLNFMVFDAIETDLEIGGDTFCIDGQWPSTMIHGLEFKDKGYLGSVTKRQDMPEQIQKVLDAFSPILNEYRYRNFWSMELRVVGDKAYFIDPTCRGGLPSLSSQMELWSNLADIMWFGSDGQDIEPIPTAKFSAECALSMKGEKNAWGKVVVPDELKDWMNLASACEIDGVICFPPDNSHDEEIGWLVATGDTIQETIETMKERVALLPDGVCANINSLADLLKEVHEAEKHDIPFTDQTVPKPEIVMQ